MPIGARIYKAIKTTILIKDILWLNAITKGSILSAYPEKIFCEVQIHGDNDKKPISCADGY